MCGIGGILGLADVDTATWQLQRMRDRLRHRGPDGEAYWLDPAGRVGLAHTRLAILDLSTRGAQPMSTADGRFVITYNGEVYNYLELRGECEAAGSRFLSDTDTEVIVECYRHWGVSAFSRFTGMWALVLYDRLKQEAVISRDPFGIKPLYHGCLEGVCYFASEPKGLIAADDRFRAVDEVTVALFEQYGYLDQGDWTFYRHIKRFPHAHFAVMSVAGSPCRLSPQRYWSPPVRPLRIGPLEAAEELGRLLRRSVELHLRSDVPVGACLSGGLDSSAIVCCGSALLGDRGRLETFTTCYPRNPQIDESAWAAQVVARIGATAHVCEPTFEFFVGEFSRVLRDQDEPFGSTSIFAQAAIYRLIAESGVKVVLCGQGADELFAGYAGCVDQYLRCLLFSRKWLTYLREIRSLRRRGQPVARFPWRNVLSMALMRRRQAGVADSVAGGELAELPERLAVINRPIHDFEPWLNDLTCNSNLPGLLRYEDRNSMANSVESRLPFLDVDLVNFALALPGDLKIRGGVTKFVLREALRGIVPEPVRQRSDKLGFPTPEEDWLQRGFNVPAEQPGGPAWRQLVTRQWRQQLGVA